MFQYYTFKISKSAEIKIGYQHLFGKSRLKPYLFIDAGYSYMRSSGRYSSFGCFGYYNNVPFLIERSTAMINPGIGIRWEMKRNLVLTYETGTEVFVSSERDLLVGMYPYRGAGIKFSPVQQLSVGFKF